MANWSGTYTISAGASGTSTGSNTSTTFNATTATWPTGAQGLTNFTVRILSGTGSGQTRVITANTATQLTVAAWGTIPDATSVYEIVLIFKNNDHITATTTLSSGIITELEDSATILVDGLYILNFQLTCLVRWNKSESTLVTFEANNRTVIGVYGFWSYISIVTTLSVTPKISYIRIRDAARSFAHNSTSVIGSSDIHHLWIENSSTNSFYNTGSNLPENRTFANVFARYGAGSSIGFASGGAFTQIFEKFWMERAFNGGPSFIAGGPTMQKVRNSIFKLAASSQNVNSNAGTTQQIEDCYYSSFTSGCIALGSVTVADAGSHIGRRNCVYTGRFFFSSTVGTGILAGAFNDFSVQKGQASAVQAYDLGVANFTSATSNSDYISGMNTASPENVDTSAATTSTAAPNQYKNLTATRTNPKSVRNRLLAVDNIVVGTPTDTQVTITFDCSNGAVSGQGSTTVNTDSASGQAVLNVASSTGFEVGEVVEVGYGTARFEEIRVLSVGAGTITGETNLVFSHTAVQADAVKKQLRHLALPYISYGTSSGVYNMQSYLPKEDDWGLYFTGIRTTSDGFTVRWNRYGHSVTLSNLKANTTYYFNARAVNPLREYLDSAELSFSTGATTGYTDPGVANVNLGTGYNFNGAAQVGTLRVPTVGQVHVGTVFGPNDTLTGTYDGSDRWTDPGDSNVRAGTAYKANSTSNNKTGRVTAPAASTVLAGVGFDTDAATVGTLSSPSAAQVADAVWDEDLTTHTTANSAGEELAAANRNARAAKNLIISES